MKKIITLLLLIALVSSCTSNSDGNSTATSVTDIDGNTYQIVTICNQTWTKTNLNVSKYRNGDIIPQVNDATQWATLTTGAWCYYNNDPTNAPIYGKLYNWFAVNDSRGLAPVGYHIPTDTEWSTMINCLDSSANGGGTSVNSNFAGGAMKEAGILHWMAPNIGATNISGFTGLPGGNRDNGSRFTNIGGWGGWWCSSEHNTSQAWSRILNYGYNFVYRGPGNKVDGISVRCLKD